MLRTGKPRSEGQIFHRRLLSEYITDFTLDNYVAYFELKAILKKIEGLREEGDKRIREHIQHVGEGRSAVTSHRVTPVSSHAGCTFPSSVTTTVSENPASPYSKAVVSPTEAATPKRSLPRHSSVSVFVDPICSPAVVNMSPLELQEELIAADPAIANIFAQREEQHKKFFDTLQMSYKKVKAFIINLEKDIIVAMMKLHKMTEEDLRTPENMDYIPSIYLQLQSVLKYRELNLVAFRRILRKFLERCACDSLDLQHRVTEVDGVISKSNVSQPSLDLRAISLELMAIYGTVWKLSYEETLDKLQQYVARSGRLAPRILPMGHTFFSQNENHFPPHQERPGSFAIRVLAGTRSLLSEKMITEVLQCPRYSSECCGKFANGEVSVNLRGKVRGDDVFLVQSMVADEKDNFSNSDAVMELMLLAHAAQLASAARITAVIPYLAYTRNVASIAAIAEMMEAMGCNHVVTVDMHSDQVEGMFSIPMESISAKYEFVQYIVNELKNQGNGFNNITIVAPNGNFLGRAKDFADAMMRYGQLDSEEQFVSVCTAVKRLNVRSQKDKEGRGGAAATRAGSPTSSEPGRGSPVVMDGTSSIEEGFSSPLAPPQRSLGFSPGPKGTGGSEIPDVAVASGECSPTSPNVFDTHFSEMDAAVAANMGRLRRDEVQSRGSNANSNPGAPGGTGDLEYRSSSTLGIEKALRKQEVGRRAVVTHQVEETTKEYENYTLVGDVAGRLCVIVDTVIDEALNICQVAQSLHANGAERIFLVATHAVLSGKCRERLINSPIELIIVTDSVNQDEAMREPKLAKKLRVVPLSPLLARAIEKIHSENTLSTMFDK